MKPRVQERGHRCSARRSTAPVSSYYRPLRSSNRGIIDLEEFYHSINPPVPEPLPRKFWPAVHEDRVISASAVMRRLVTVLPLVRGMNQFRRGDMYPTLISRPGDIIDV